MKDRVLIENYEVLACHGVNPEEKVTPQRFLVSCELFLDASKASKEDDLNQTASYSAVCKRIKSFFGEKVFNLLETLADRLARILLLEFPVERVEMTIKKPDAPMKGTFDFVGVSVSREWHTAYLSLGSNMGDKNAYLNLAVSSLKDDKNVKDVRESARISTQPYGGVAQETFVNSAVCLKTLYTPHELLDRLQEIEEKGERRRDIRWGDRTLDMDVIFYDGEIIEDADLCVPHIDMQNREFVLAPLNELCPNKLHPVLKKRVCELLSSLQLQNK